jgi:4a-hydroxytetrahydrobiopterin dehydratase
MGTQTAGLLKKHCKPCEGGLPGLDAGQMQLLLPEVPKWRVTDDGKKIRREWKVKDFATALDFFNRIGQVAEEEGHHPDLQLVGYRNVAVELTTHALKGLSENDFILAAKIDQLPVEVKG